MARAGIFNVTIEQGSTYKLTITCQDSNGDAVDLSGYSARGKVRKSYSSSASTVDFTCSLQSPATLGKIDAELTASQTTSLEARKYVYDIEIYLASGYTKRIVEGKVSVVPEVTK